jgi:hypothetical protein
MIQGALVAEAELVGNLPDRGITVAQQLAGGVESSLDQEHVWGGIEALLNAFLNEALQGFQWAGASARALQIVGTNNSENARL